MSEATSTSPASLPVDGVTGVEWNQIREALRGLRYGSVSIIVQDGVIVQIDRLEKRRIRKNDGVPRSVH